MRWIDRQYPERQRREVCDFQVIGELKGEPKHLLLRGDDGQYYCMDASSGNIQQLEPDDSWAVDLVDNAALRIEVPWNTLAP